MALRLIVRAENGEEVECDIDLAIMQPDKVGEYLDNERDGMAVVEAVANALKKMEKLS